MIYFERCAWFYSCLFPSCQKQVEDASQEVHDLEARHEAAQDEVNRIKAGRETTIKEALAKRREIKNLQVSV
jgi:hypothetical protein